MALPPHQLAEQPSTPQAACPGPSGPTLVSSQLPGQRPSDDDFNGSRKKVASVKRGVKSRSPNVTASEHLSVVGQHEEAVEEGEPFKMEDAVREELEKHEWYHDAVPQEDVDMMLTKEGDFLLRKIGSRGQPVVTVRYRNSSVNVLINRKEVNGTIMYSIGDTKEFNTIMQAALFHHQNGIAVFGSCKLIRPIQKQAWEICRSDLRIAEKLGEGAFGEVFSGELVIKKATTDSSEKRVPVAVKMLSANKASSTKKEVVMKMHEEARLMRQYTHQNVVRLHGVLFSQDESMIVMELVKGGGLDKYLQKNPGTPVRVRCSYCFDIAAGLAYLHVHSCLHRDIAARNCLVSEDGQIAKLSDFGQSHRGLQYNIPTTERIPVRWSAPEVITRGFCVKESDVWSYGVLIWEIFNDAKIPHEGLETKFIRENSETLRLSDVSEPVVNNIMKRCFDNNYHSRPSMINIAKELRKYCIHEIQTIKMAGKAHVKTQKSMIPTEPMSGPMENRSTKTLQKGAKSKGRKPAAAEVGNLSVKSTAKRTTSNDCMNKSVKATATKKNLESSNDRVVKKKPKEAKSLDKSEDRKGGGAKKTAIQSKARQKKLSITDRSSE